MPYLQRDRTPVDAKREADRSYDSNLILYAVLLVASVVIILFCACLLTAKWAAADEALPGQRKPNHTCEETESWVAWDELVSRHPDSMELKALYALRIGLCTQIKAGKLTVDQGTAIFEQARRSLIQAATWPRAKAQSKL
jgi:hypothetical protein